MGIYIYILFCWHLIKLQWDLQCQLQISGNILHQPVLIKSEIGCGLSILWADFYRNSLVFENIAHGFFNVGTHKNCSSTSVLTADIKK